MTRQTFDIPRAAEFLELRALQAQTGVSAESFADVIAKELLDNALDASETAGVVPDIEFAASRADGLLRITVADNGPGMSREVVERILNFGNLVSDKATYRSPTRGAQGNAWKTVLGIPFALGVSAPIVVEAQGVRHDLAVSIDPGGNVLVRHDRAESPRIAGTAVTVPLPDRLTLRPWLEDFAAINPHATFTSPAKGGLRTEPVSYKATAPDGWRKPLPGDPSSPWWYDAAALRKLVFAHIGAARRGGRDLPLGEFIREFAGLSSTAKAKAVATYIPAIRYLSDFEKHPDLVVNLLAAMQAQAKRPKPAILGRVGEDHLLAHLRREYGVERHWYRHREVDVDGIPWAIEVVVAETLNPGRVLWATNYSPAFREPLAHASLAAGEVRSTGAASWLRLTDAYPDDDNGRLRAAIVHVACAAPEFVDKGKSVLNVPTAVADAVAAALHGATRELHQEARRAQRDALAAAKAREQRRKPVEKTTLKDAVFAVIDDAVAHESHGGTIPFPTRNLFYSARKLIQQHTDAELKYGYFRDALVVEWEREHGPIPGHYREPRGELREPHGGERIELGSREVADYVIPPYRYNKILYVEKEGFNPVFEAARLHERYDMAIATGKGQPVLAIRELFARAEAADTEIKLLVLHDADDAGYSIARTMAEETARMPDYRVEVIDLGLTVADAIRLGLQTEKYTRRKELHWWMPERLTEQEMAWFGGRRLTPSWQQRAQWECTRVELNALGPGLVAYIEEGLQRHGATAKVIPPQDHITSRAKAAFAAQVDKLVEDTLAEIIDLPALQHAIRTELRELVLLDDITPLDITEAFERSRNQAWDDVVSVRVGKRIDASGLDVRAHIVELLAERNTDG